MIQIEEGRFYEQPTGPALTNDGAWITQWFFTSQAMHNLGVRRLVAAFYAPSKENCEKPLDCGDLSPLSMCQGKENCEKAFGVR